MTRIDQQLETPSVGGGGGSGDDRGGGESFAEACRRTVGGLRAAILQLYGAINADPARPQDVSRQFNINKNLTWKVSRLLQCDDGLDAVSFIPGPGGLEILLDAAVGSGADADSVDAVRRAMVGFNQMVERHAGDRADLELLIDSTASRPLELSRRLAFRSNAGVWGLQARLRVTAKFLAPSAQGGTLDSALVAGAIDVRRLRPIQRWPLFRFAQYNDDASAVDQRCAPEPIEALRGGESEGGWAWLLRSWCSEPLPPLHIVEEDAGVVYEIGDGPVGRTGQFSCIFGLLHRECFSRHRDEHNLRGELSASISMPTETFLYDVYTHRDLTETAELEAALYGRPTGVIALDADQRRRQRLPMSERLTDLGGPPPHSATPLMPEWSAIMNQVFERAGWNPRDFVARRLVLEHPPMPATVMLSYALPTV